MQMALLLGANPRNITRGPKVWLRPGKWRFDVDGVVDSQLSLHINPSLQVEVGIVFEIEEFQAVEIIIKKQGTEQTISAYAAALRC